MDAELRFHIEAYAEDLVRTGIPRDEAMRRARIEFGGIERAKEECRDATRANLFDSFLQDIRYGLRMLRKSPGFTVVAILTLALGIGTNTAIFSAVEGVVLAPLQYRDADRVVMILESNLRFPKDAISYPNFQDWQRTARSFQQMSAIMVQQGFDLTAPGTPEHMDGNRISAGFFGTLGVNLALGREFSALEDKHAGPPVAIISNRLWRDRFDSSPQVLGKSAILDGVAYTIIGVTSPGFRLFSSAIDVYVPLGQGDPLILNARATHDSMISIARLKPGVSISQAQTEMSTVQAQLDQLYPEEDAGLGVDVLPLKGEIVGDVSATLLLLLSAVGLVLLIACANVGNLFLARSAARKSEFAIRSALGASRGRIVRQLVTESVFLSLVGGVVGLIVAALGVKLVLASLPLNLPRTENIQVNAFVLLFALGISVAVGILFGLAPALQSVRTDPQAALKEGGRGSIGAHHRAQSSLVIVQMALTLVLLVAAGLLFRTIRHLWETDPGFDTNHVIAFKVGLSPSLTRKGSTLRAGFLQSLERIRSIPGVQAADFTMLVPLTDDDNDTPFWIGSDKPAVLQNAPRMLVFDTGPDYLRTMGIPLLRGRFFTREDTINSPCVAVIDSVFARAYFPGKDPVGQHLTFGFPVAPWGPCSIIGIVGHVALGIGQPRHKHRSPELLSSLPGPRRIVAAGLSLHADSDSHATRHRYDHPCDQSASLWRRRRPDCV